jgi:hypothetical protein
MSVLLLVVLKAGSTVALMAVLRVAKMAARKEPMWVEQKAVCSAAMKVGA